MKKNLGAIILAAGKGKRMNSTTVNKVAMNLASKPMILHAIHLLQKTNIKTIVVVVGFAKDSVKRIINEDVIFAEQHKRLGTAHAALKGLVALPKFVTDVLIIQGDDSAFYKKETLENLINLHRKEKNSLTFLTIEVKNPTGLGRVLRDENGNVQAVVEEKDATEKQRSINEINPACYVMGIAFLRKYLKKVQKSPVTGEYYLTSLIDIAIKNKERINALNGGNLPWRGVNTKDELVEAEKLLNQI